MNQDKLNNTQWSNSRDVRRKIVLQQYLEPKTVYESLLIGVPHIHPVEIQKEKAPVKLLDAPNVIDNTDFSILDWSSQDVIALGLSNNLFLRNLQTRTTQLIRTLQNNVFTSVRLMDEVLVFSDDQGSLGIMDAESKQMLQSHQIRTIVHQSTFGDNLLGCATKSEGTLIFDLRQRHYIYKLGGHLPYYSIQFNGTLLASGMKGEVMVWDIRNPKLALSANCFDGTTLQWSEHKLNHLLSGGDAGLVYQWKYEEGKGEQIYKIEDTITQIISMDSNVIVSSGNEIRNGKWVFRRHSEKILRMALSPDRKQLCSLGVDELLIFWEI